MDNFIKLHFTADAPYPLPFIPREHHPLEDMDKTDADIRHCVLVKNSVFYGGAAVLRKAGL